MNKVLKLSDVVLKFEHEVCGAAIQDFANEIGNELPLNESGVTKLCEVFGECSVIETLISIFANRCEDMYKDFLRYLEIPFCEFCFRDFDVDILSDAVSKIDNLNTLRKRTAVLEILQAVLATATDEG